MTDRQWTRLTLLLAGVSSAACIFAAGWLTYRLTRFSAYLIALREPLDAPGMAHESLQVVALRDQRTLAWLLAVLLPLAILAIARLVRRTVYNVP